MQKTAMFYLKNCDLWKLSKLEKKTFQESIWKMTNSCHCLPAYRSMVCVFWTAQHQHGQESVRNWAVRASGADNATPNMEKKAMIGRNKLWRAMTRCDSRGCNATIGSPLYPCQTYFLLSHGNGCHTMLKSRKKRILWAKKNKIWKFGWFSAR